MAGRIIHGTVARIRTYIPKTLKPVRNEIFKTRGKKESSMTVSFENLVNILPIGLESKNTTGALSNFQSAFLWIFIEENITNVNIDKDLMNDRTTYPITKEQ